jgi:hypothetical protein
MVMKITEKQFKERCLAKVSQSREFIHQSLFFYMYITCLDEKDDSPFAIPQDGVKLADLVAPSTIEKAEKVGTHLKSLNDKIKKEVSHLKSLVKELESRKAKAGKALEGEPADDAIDDYEDEKMKWEKECLDSDKEDLSRIHTIDINNSFSFERVANFYISIGELYYNLPMLPEQLEVRIGRFFQVEEYENSLRDIYRTPGTRGWVTVRGL